MEKSLVSIIVPVYNIEKYIEACIESIQRQTYQKIQIILVDDGSDDRSGLICDEYAQHDSRIEVIHKENGGLVSARKAGLMAAKGCYIGFVDGDDYIAEEMYQELVEEMEESGADLVHSGYWEKDVKRGPSERNVVTVPEDKTKVLEAALLKAESYGMSYSIWSKLFRAELVKRSYARVPDRCSYGEDVINLCVCLLECKKIALLNRAFYYYRVRNDSLSHRNNMDMLKNIFELYNGLCDIFHLYDCYEKQTLDLFLWNELYQCMGKISRDDFRIARYYFHDVDRLWGKRIVIYGAGAVGKDYYAQISRYRECEIAAWIDTRPEKYHYPHIRVEGPEYLRQIVFDLLLIAVENERTANEIQGQLLQMGIAPHQIDWSKPMVYGLENRGNRIDR